MMMFDQRNSWRFVVAVVAYAVLLVLCSCNPAPKYARPPVNAPQAFKESAPPQFKEGDGWKVAQPGDDKIRGNWWETYNDPVLNSLEQQVQISNQTVIQAEANYRASRALVVAAIASLFPAISNAPSLTHSRFSSTPRTAVVVPGSTAATGGTGASGGAGPGTGGGGGGGGSASNIVNNFSLPFEAAYTVDFWHRIRNQV